MEQQTVSLKQCVSEVTGKQIAMNGKDFIYLIDKTKVETSVLDEAVILKKQKEDKELLINWKTERQTKVDNIEVTYNNVIYQGDEVSQTRMSRAIASMNDTDVVLWVAKDNSVHSLTKADLQAILKDAGTQQSVIWVTGRPQV